MVRVANPSHVITSYSIHYTKLYDIVGDLAYEVQVECELIGDVQAGLLLFYNRRLYCGLAYSADGFVMHRYGLQRKVGAPADLGRKLWLRIRNDRNIVTIWHSQDGQQWTQFYVQMEVSGYHHNVAYDFLSLRPGIYAAGNGEVRYP